MLLTYGMSIAGTSHIKKNIPCQDSNRFESLSNGWVAASVADGVGSAKHSDIASAIACDVFIDTCKALVTNDSKISDAKDIIATAYRNAEEKIREYVAEKGDEITDYDTTLSAVIYDGEKFSYGHSGDGGIVIISNDGEYIKVTKPQKGADGISVIPLRAGENSWEFGFCETKTAVVLLATDGVYDSFNPYLLKGQPNELYIPVVRWFTDNNIIGISADNLKAVEESRRRFLTGENTKSITDDKTVVVVFNSEIKPILQDPSFYAEPDWIKLQDIWNRKAYPHLYKDEAEGTNEEQVEEDTSYMSEVPSENDSFPTQAQESKE